MGHPWWRVRAAAAGSEESAWQVVGKQGRWWQFRAKDFFWRTGAPVGAGRE
jgi:hypothetical protein